MKAVIGAIGVIVMVSFVIWMWGYFFYAAGGDVIRKYKGDKDEAI